VRGASGECGAFDAVKRRCTHDLRASFFHSSKPTWWNASPGPAIGPDVSGGSDCESHAYTIPAQDSYAKTVAASQPFRGSSCY
jgi:hypothetical protein